MLQPGTAGLLHAFDSDASNSNALAVVALDFLGRKHQLPVPTLDSNCRKQAKSGLATLTLAFHLHSPKDNFGLAHSSMQTSYTLAFRSSRTERHEFIQECARFMALGSWRYGGIRIVWDLILALST